MPTSSSARCPMVTVSMQARMSGIPRRFAVRRYGPPASVVAHNDRDPAQSDRRHRPTLRQPGMTVTRRAFVSIAGVSGYRLGYFLA